MIVLIAVLVAVIWLGVAYRPNYTELIDSCAEKYDVDSDLISAIMRQESSFRAGALSSKGAVGLMQLMPSTAQWIADKSAIAEFDLYSPKDNVTLAILYIKYLEQKYNDIDLVIIAYNAGEGNVDRWLQLSSGVLKDNIPYAETRDYYRKVISSYRVYTSFM